VRTSLQELLLDLLIEQQKVTLDVALCLAGVAAYHLISAFLMQVFYLVAVPHFLAHLAVILCLSFSVAVGAEVEVSGPLVVLGLACFFGTAGDALDALWALVVYLQQTSHLLLALFGLST
jgi:hypothetical protein